MASRAAHKRLTKEYKALQADWPPYIYARPEEGNILIWHYVFLGPSDSPYEGGEYHGTLTFPDTYPFAPPAIRMMTPSGRFVPDSRICTSMSDFHPGLFNPAWGISTILVGLLSFMVSEENTAGSTKASTEDRRRLALASRAYNRNPIRSRKFLEVFKEELVTGEMDRLLRENKNKIPSQATTGNEDTNPTNPESGITTHSEPVLTTTTEPQSTSHTTLDDKPGMTSQFARWRWGE